MSYRAKMQNAIQILATLLRAHILSPQDQLDRDLKLEPDARVRFLLTSCADVIVHVLALWTNYDSAETYRQLRALFADRQGWIWGVCRERPFASIDDMFRGN